VLFLLFEINTSLLLRVLKIKNVTELPVTARGKNTIPREKPVSKSRM
jgi:hypothetical protein